MKWGALTKLGCELPEVTVDTWYRTPALKVRGKGFVRLREDGETVVFVVPDIDTQELLCDALPDVFYITDHYEGWRAVLARLPKLRTAVARERLEQAWRAKAPKSLIRKFDA